MPTRTGVRAQVVRLGENVFREGRMTPMRLDLAARPWRAWRRTITSWMSSAVRAVGTSAVRDATNRREFLARATQILGNARGSDLRPGRSPADSPGRAGSLAAARKRALIIDVGGGSAELILSDHGGHVGRLLEAPGRGSLDRDFPQSRSAGARRAGAHGEYIEEKLAGPVERIGSGPSSAPWPPPPPRPPLVCAVNRVRRAARDEADRLKPRPRRSAASIATSRRWI